MERAPVVLKPNGSRAEGWVGPSINELALQMPTSCSSSLPSDISLLLRADAEQSWLHREVIPVLRQVETRERLPDELLGAALAYLEAMWSEATVRARNTDAAHAHLSSREGGHNSLSAPADRYHTAVRALRGILAERVTPLVDPPVDDPPVELEQGQSRLGHVGVRVKDTRDEARRPNAGGCAPRAA